MIQQFTEYIGRFLTLVNSYLLGTPEVLMLFHPAKILLRGFAILFKIHSVYYDIFSHSSNFIQIITYIRLQACVLIHTYIHLSKLGLEADPVIEAIARLEFEDGLRTGVLPGGCWYPCGGCT